MGEGGISFDGGGGGVQKKSWDGGAPPPCPPIGETLCNINKKLYNFSVVDSFIMVFLDF